MKNFNFEVLVIFILIFTLIILHLPMLFLRLLPNQDVRGIYIFRSILINFFESILFDLSVFNVVILRSTALR
jgi:hypothetical protein